MRDPERPDRKPDDGASRGPSGGDRKEPEPGRIHSTPPQALVVFGLLGLVLGWLLRPVSIAVQGTAPTVPWLQILVLFFVAAIMGAVAFATWRSLQRRHERIEPHRAVNRLVLGKACALAGAAIAGGYFGYALAFLGLTDAALARSRAVHSLFGGVAGLLLMVAALTLERACRAGSDDDPDLP